MFSHFSLSLLSHFRYLPHWPFLPPPLPPPPTPPPSAPSAPHRWDFPTLGQLVSSFSHIQGVRTACYYPSPGSRCLPPVLQLPARCCNYPCNHYEGEDKGVRAGRGRVPFPSPFILPRNYHLCDKTNWRGMGCTWASVLTLYMDREQGEKRGGGRGETEGERERERKEKCRMFFD